MGIVALFSLARAAKSPRSPILVREAPQDLPRNSLAQSCLDVGPFGFGVCKHRHGVSMIAIHIISALLKPSLFSLTPLHRALFLLLSSWRFYLLDQANFCLSFSHSSRHSLSPGLWLVAILHLLRLQPRISLNTKVHCFTCCSTSRPVRSFCFIDRYTPSVATSIHLCIPGFVPT
jgi:hypothetical protein